jgi:hypothetical protein
MGIGTAPMPTGIAIIGTLNSPVQCRFVVSENVIKGIGALSTVIGIDYDGGGVNGFPGLVCTGNIIDLENTDCTGIRVLDSDLVVVNNNSISLSAVTALSISYGIYMGTVRRGVNNGNTIFIAGTAGPSRSIKHDEVVSGVVSGNMFVSASKHVSCSAVGAVPIPPAPAFKVTFVSGNIHSGIAIDPLENSGAAVVVNRGRSDVADNPLVGPSADADVDLNIRMGS